MNPMVRGQIETHTSVEGFFADLLTEALGTERLALDATSRSYLLNLFSDFTLHDHLHTGAKQGESGTPALAWLYERAAHAEPGRRFEALRHLGDVALVVAGFFGPHIERERSVVGVGYYIDMGTAAYDTASTLAHKGAFGSMLRELAQKFRRLVEVLTRIAERIALPVVHDVSSLYARILRNPESLVLHRRLIDQGAVPVFGSVVAA